MVASVTNQNGGAVGGFDVTFTIQTLTGGASATFTGACSAQPVSSPPAPTGRLLPRPSPQILAQAPSISPRRNWGRQLSNFPGTNEPDVAHAIMTIVSTNPMSAQVGAAFGKLEVNIKDPNGNPVVGQNVVFTAPASGASGTFGNGTNTETDATDANGNATTTAFTANHTAGTNYAISAVATGTPIPSKSFTATNTPARRPR